MDPREKVAKELLRWYSKANPISCHKEACAILALVDAEYRPLIEATLAVLECGVDPGPHHMETLEGRVAWIDRMKPVRERLRAVLAAMKEES